jgi:hypothetical protein
MSQFAQALRQYRSGLLSRKQLLAEIETHLAERPADAGALLAWLSAEHARAELPADTYLELTRQIRESSRVGKVARPSWCHLTARRPFAMPIYRRPSSSTMISCRCSLV